MEWARLAKGKGGHYGHRQPTQQNTTKEGLWIDGMLVSFRTREGPELDVVMS